MRFKLPDLSCQTMVSISFFVLIFLKILVVARVNAFLSCNRYCLN